MIVVMQKCENAEIETALDAGIAHGRCCTEDPGDEGTVLVYNG